MSSSEKPTVSLMFHDVKEKPYRWNLTPEFFLEIIEIINFQMDMVTITIDDGGIGNYKYIYPTLEKYGLKGIFFIPTLFINTAGNNRPTYMTRGQIQEIFRSGHIIGSHSHSHPKNISLLKKDKVLEEWKVSKTILEDITGHTVTTCSIPGGFYNPEHLPFLGSLGYKQVFTSMPIYGTTESNGLQISGRFSIENNISMSNIMSLIKRDLTLQSYLYLRHLLSRNIHTILHKFGI
jgi:peptidoglycan/xylan/chitin deacetylase (PgdA/CDA1 family)